MDVDALWGALRQRPGDMDVRNKIVEHYLPIVTWQARKLLKKVGSRVDLGDLIADGAIGLMSAVGSFDPSRGVRFETFAPTRVHGAMIDGIRSRDWMTRLERNKQRLGEEVANVVAIGEQDVSGARGVDLSGLARDDLRRIAIRGLNLKEQAIVDLYYFEQMTMREIGEALDLSASRVSQMHDDILSRVRDRMSRHVESFL